MGDIMEFPDTVEEFMEEYKMVDKHEIYSNGTEYVPIFRMEQWFEHCKAQSANAKRYIDADAYLHELEELIIARLDWTSVGKIEIHGLNVAICSLENQPTADVVEVVHGGWVVDEDSAYIDAHCSECGMQVRYNKFQQFDCFCRRCGAKMDGER